MSHDDSNQCHTEKCQRPARMAVRTRRPQRDNVIVTVWTDDRAAAVPNQAEKYCREHGMQLLSSLMTTLVDSDADEPAPPVEPAVSHSPLVTDYLAKPCSACNAHVGERCSAPTNEGRRYVSWVHYAREKA